MLELNKGKHDVAPTFRSASAGGAHLKVGATDIDCDIASTDEEIDNLVYELYSITREERNGCQKRKTLKT